MKFIIISTLVAAIAAPASACSPPRPETFAHTPQRVKAMFDSSANVVLATVSDVRTVKVTCGGIYFPMDAEQVTFRIDRAFKGRYKSGKAVVLRSVSSCARSAVYSSAIPTPGAKREKRPRQWLLYMDDPADTEITDFAETRTIDQASYDIPILEQLSGRYGRLVDHADSQNRPRLNCVLVK